MRELDFATIGQKIKARRQALGIKQEFIANALDVNPSHISNIECGRAAPSLTALINIANVLKCSVDVFLEEEYTYPEKQIPEINMQILRKLDLMDKDHKDRFLKIIDLI